MYNRATVPVLETFWEALEIERTPPSLLQGTKKLSSLIVEKNWALSSIVHRP